ncbi:MAG: Hsp20/alpha crystallin family protein [Calditrichaeota bacterium]|nr:MAG: Hsp20/alpha crystallin family protein [Calditrichota bacterium]
MTLTRWNPTRELTELEREMDRLMDRFFNMDRFFSPDLFGDLNVFTRGWVPAMDILENDDEFIVNLELPGINKDDVNITYRDGFLTIEGERKQEAEDKNLHYHRTERRYGKFVRSFRLPTDIKEDQIEAVYKDGILTLHLPKVETAKPKHIEVKVEK